MGRELKRVPLDFDWPLDQPWQGYINPLYRGVSCPYCEGSGSSATARRLTDLWYGNAPFAPEDRGSVAFTTEDAPIRSLAERNVGRSPEYFGTGEFAVQREARRLARLMNGAWRHHLNADDVAALIASNRLYDLTHTYTPHTGWQPKQPPYVPTPREVNLWSLSGMGHDSINQWVCVRAECQRLGVAEDCEHCSGAGDTWPSAEAKQAYDDWQRSEPPDGPGYQIWETISEGSPISPVFSTAEALARHMATTKWGADTGSSAETWLKFIEGPGWAPTGVIGADGPQSGVEAVVRRSA